jgi:hypothetical protein
MAMDRIVESIDSAAQFTKFSSTARQDRHGGQGTESFRAR